MGTNAEKHARQRENRARAQSASVGSGRSRTVITVVALLGAAVIVALVVWLVGRGDDGDDEAATDTTAPTDTTASTDTTAPGEGVALPAPPEGLTLTGTTPCPPAAGSAQRVQAFAGPPPTCIDPAANTFSATFSTTEGSFTAELDAEAAPVTVNNFVVLARYHFYDGVPFHRIVPGFVIQAGDGDGEPWGNNDLGYTSPDELPSSSDAYTDYSLAMANAGPDTNGSQFFVLLPGGGAQLGPSFSRFGEVTEGREVVDAIGQLAGPDQQPTKAVLIKSVGITETPR